MKIWFIIIFLLFCANRLFSQEQTKSKNLIFSNSHSVSYPRDIQDKKLDSLVADPNRDYAYWLDFGVGGSYYGTTIYTGLSYVKKKLWLAFRYYWSREQQNIYDQETARFPSKSCFELGVLAGIIFRNKNLAFGIAGGLAYLNGTDRGNLIEGVYYEYEKVSCISFPIETRFRLSVNGVVGGGVSIISNINSHKTHFGVILEITFGLL